MIIYANRPYTVGKFYQYINVGGLIPFWIKHSNQFGKWQDGYLSVAESCRLFDKVGRNTG